MAKPHPSYRAGSDGGVAGADAGHARAPQRAGTGPTLLTEGRVVALHRGKVVGAGAILERGLVEGTHLVSAQSPEGRSWWIPAGAVWADGESTTPQHPRPVGLATAADLTTATLQGLSDRLGWEAVMHLERGYELPPLPGDVDFDAGPFVLLDGRLDHDIPTVVVIGEELTRWGAASTWGRALHRALYGDHGLAPDPDELAAMADALAKLGLHPVTVDLGTPRLRQLGINRCSVQLLAAS